MGCCKSDNGGTAVRSTLILGAALGLSFLFLILAAAIYHDYLPFLNIAFIVLVPVAVIIGDVMGGSSSYGTSETSVAWANFGHCSFGTIMISMFGLPLVLLHIDAVSIRNKRKCHELSLFISLYSFATGTFTLLSAVP